LWQSDDDILQPYDDKVKQDSDTPHRDDYCLEKDVDATKPVFLQKRPDQRIMECTLAASGRAGSPLPAGAWAEGKADYLTKFRVL
jgi:hypothetical protein